MRLLTLGAVALCLVSSGCGAPERLELAVGGLVGCVRSSDGQAACWGGTVRSGPFRKSYEGSRVPVVVSNLPRPRALCAGSVFACALREGAKVSCWSTEQAQPRAAEVAGLADVTHLACGGAGGCAVSSGQVRCWDWVEEVAGSVQVIPDLGDVQQVVVGDAHRCALTREGRVRCWGDNAGGQLGVDPSMTRTTETPVEVPSLLDVAALAAGAEHTCALGTDGRVRCFGSNEVGQLGHAAGSTFVPLDVDGLTDVTAITAGARHGCALLADGTARCWGWNRNGQIGDGSDLDRKTPVAVPGLAEVKAIAAGDAHTCAMTSDGRVLCWGSNQNGQLGDGTFDGRREPGEVRF